MGFVVGKIRHIASSEGSPIFLAAEFKTAVCAWDADRLCQISAFDTVMDFGGDRLAVSGDGKICIAAAYERCGICAYETETGNLLWQRKDIKRTQRVKFRPGSSELYVGSEEGPMRILDGLTGESIGSLRATGKIYFNLYGENIFIQHGARFALHGSRKLSPPNFYCLNACGVKHGVVLSSMGEGLYCYNHDGQLIWELRPKPGHEHFLDVAYSEKHDIIFALLYKYTQERKLPHNVLYGIRAQSGEVVYQWGLHDEIHGAFSFMRGERLICSSGKLLKVSDHPPELLHHFHWQ